MLSGCILFVRGSQLRYSRRPFCQVFAGNAICMNLFSCEILICFYVLQASLREWDCINQTQKRYRYFTSGGIQEKHGMENRIINRALYPRPEQRCFTELSIKKPCMARLKHIADLVSGGYKSGSWPCCYWERRSLHLLRIHSRRCICSQRPCRHQLRMSVLLIWRDLQESER